MGGGVANHKASPGQAQPETGRVAPSRWHGTAAQGWVWLA